MFVVGNVEVQSLIVYFKGYIKVDGLTFLVVIEGLCMLVLICHVC